MLGGIYQIKQENVGTCFVFYLNVQFLTQLIIKSDVHAKIFFLPVMERDFQMLSLKIYSIPISNIFQKDNYNLSIVDIFTLTFFFILSILIFLCFKCSYFVIFFFLGIFEICGTTQSYIFFTFYIFIVIDSGKIVIFKFNYFPCPLTKTESEFLKSPTFFPETRSNLPELIRALQQKIFPKIGS